MPALAAAACMNTCGMVAESYLFLYRESAWMLSEGGLRLFRDRLQFEGDLRVQKHGMLVFSDFLHNCFYLSLLLKGVQTTSARLVAAHCCRAFVVMDTSFF